MEALVSEHGVSGLLAGIIIVLALHLVVKLGEFVVDLLKKKSEITEKTIDNLKESIENSTRMLGTTVEAIHRLEERARSLETRIAELDKFKIDVRMLFQAIKSLAGDKWPDLKKSISDDKFIL